MIRKNDINQCHLKAKTIVFVNILNNALLFTDDTIQALIFNNRHNCLGYFNSFLRNVASVFLYLHPE